MGPAGENEVETRGKGSCQIGTHRAEVVLKSKDSLEVQILSSNWIRIYDFIDSL